MTKGRHLCQAGKDDLRKRLSLPPFCHCNIRLHMTVGLV